MIKNKIKKYFPTIYGYVKENWLFLLTLLVIFNVMTYPLPYYIDTGGGIISINDRIEVANEQSSTGTFNMAYVSEVKATLPTYIISYFFNTWERVKVEDVKITPSETQEDVEERDKLYMDTANQTAIQVAYKKANKYFKILGSKTRIAYISENAITDLKIGDTIIEINGSAVTDYNSLYEAIEINNIGDILNIKVLRDEKEANCTAKIFGSDTRKLVGISIMEKYDYETDPEIKLNFLASESGPSGGLLMSLAIYDKLTEKDLTKGLKIVGTGTIAEDGTVGSIGGVTYKLRGAVNAKADVFIVPIGANYNDAMKLKEEKGFSIDIIGVSTFDEAVEKLENYQK